MPWAPFPGAYRSIFPSASLPPLPGPAPAPPPPLPSTPPGPVASQIAKTGLDVVSLPVAGGPPAPQPVGAGMVAFFPATIAVRRTYVAMPSGYACPQWPGVYCPAAAVRPMPEDFEDEAAALETPVAAKVATVGGLGALLVVGLAAGGAFGG